MSVKVATKIGDNIFKGVGALAAPAEEWGSVPSTHKRELTSTCNFSSRGSDTFFCLPHVLHKCGVRIDSQMGVRASLKRQELAGYGDGSVGLLHQPEALSLDSPAQQDAEARVYNLSTGRGAEAGKS